MIYHWLAGLVVALHGTFVLFVVLGGFLVLRWPRVIWAHVPAATWGALIEFAGWICPLTPLENMLRARGGQAGYSGGFIEHYLVPLLYPSGLTARIRWVLGGFVILINLLAYGLLLLRARRAAAMRAG